MTCVRKPNQREPTAPEVEPTVVSGSDDGPLIYSSYIIINYIYQHNTDIKYVFVCMEGGKDGKESLDLEYIPISYSSAQFHGSIIEYIHIFAIRINIHKYESYAQYRYYVSV